MNVAVNIVNKPITSIPLMFLCFNSYLRNQDVNTILADKS